MAKLDFLLVDFFKEKSNLLTTKLRNIMPRETLDASGSYRDTVTVMGVAGDAFTDVDSQICQITPGNDEPVQIGGVTFIKKGTNGGDSSKCGTFAGYENVDRACLEQAQKDIADQILKPEHLLKFGPKLGENDKVVAPGILQIVEDPNGAMQGFDLVSGTMNYSSQSVDKDNCRVPSGWVSAMGGVRIEGNPKMNTIVHADIQGILDGTQEALLRVICIEGEVTLTSRDGSSIRVLKKSDGGLIIRDLDGFSDLRNEAGANSVLAQSGILEIERTTASMGIDRGPRQQTESGCAATTDGGAGVVSVLALTAVFVAGKTRPTGPTKKR